jgi:hypothetical protein
MASLSIQATPLWVREGPAPGATSGFNAEMQVNGTANVGGTNKQVQVVVRVQDLQALDLDYDQTYRITVEEV